MNQTTITQQAHTCADSQILCIKNCCKESANQQPKNSQFIQILPLDRKWLQSFSIKLSLFMILAFTISGCSWTKDHLDGGAWARAANPIQKNHWGSLALFSTLPYFKHNDDRLSRDLAQRQPYAGKEGSSKGDIVMGALAASPLLVAGIAATLPEHDGEAMEILEVAVEATILSGLVAEALKGTVRRKRPNNNSGRGGRAKASRASFPSGHVMTAMTGAALTGRWLREQNPWFGIVEAMLYGGVGYVGITRIENDKHYPSDVIGSMVMAHYLATTIWDAHFGLPEKEGIFHKIRKHALPVPMEDGAGIMFHFEF